MAQAAQTGTGRRQLRQVPDADLNSVGLGRLSVRPTTIDTISGAYRAGIRAFGTEGPRQHLGSNISARACEIEVRNLHKLLMLLKLLSDGHSESNEPPPACVPARPFDVSQGVA